MILTRGPGGRGGCGTGQGRNDAASAQVVRAAGFIEKCRKKRFFPLDIPGNGAIVLLEL